jgi:hypothetical protein
MEIIGSAAVAGYYGFQSAEINMLPNLAGVL